MNVKYIPGADPEMLFFDANNKEVKVGIVNVHTGFIQYPLFEFPTLIDLLRPSNTTSFVGRVIVCSFGVTSALGGLLTRGTETFQ